MRKLISTGSAAERRAEMELLLCCARAQFDPEKLTRVRPLTSDEISWEDVVRLSLRHGLAPLLYRNLSKLFPELAPENILRRLETCFRFNAARNLFLTGELLKLLSLFERFGVKAIPFKGPVLSATAYGDLTLRQFADLDVLIHRGDLEKTKDLLLARGYRPRRQMTKAEEAKHLGSEHAYAFVSRDGNVKLDLHWKLAQRHYSFGLDSDVLWERLQRVSLAGRDLLTLHHEDLLLYLCLHGSKHRWERLAWICDVAALLRMRGDWDWERIINRARDLNLERVLFLGLRLANDLLYAPLPEQGVLQIEKDPAVAKLCSRVKDHLFSTNHRQRSEIEKAIYFWKIRERLEDRVPYLFFRFRKAVTPNERDENMLPLPDPLFFLYYPLRLVRLTAGYVFDAFGSRSNQPGK